MEYICPSCNLIVNEESFEGDTPECPLCGVIMKKLSVEKYDWEVEQMKKDIKKNNANFVWKEIEKYSVWQYRVKLRKLFFEAIKQLKIPFEINWEE